MTEHHMLYEIRVRGHLSPTWSEWFDGLQVTTTEGGNTVLAGHVVDQAALFGILARVQALNLTLLAITQCESDKASDLSDSRENVS